MGDTGGGRDGKGTRGGAGGGRAPWGTIVLYSRREGGDGPRRRASAGGVGCALCFSFSFFLFSAPFSRGRLPNAPRGWVCGHGRPAGRARARGVGMPPARPHPAIHPSTQPRTGARDIALRCLRGVPVEMCTERTHMEERNRSTCVQCTVQHVVQRRRLPYCTYVYTLEAVVSTALNTVHTRRPASHVAAGGVTQPRHGYPTLTRPANADSGALSGFTDDTVAQ